LATSTIGVAALLGALVGTTGSPARAAAAGQDGRVRIGQVPALPAGTSSLGAVPADTQLQIDVALRPQDPAALSSYATAVSTPGSPAFRRYLTVPEFASVFGATSAAIARVESNLAASGLHAGPVSANHLVIPVSGSAAQMERAFSTGLVRYRFRTRRVGYSNSAAPSMPAAVAPYVQTVVGLDDVHQEHSLMTQPASSSRATHALAQATALSSSPQPCGAARSLASAVGTYTADQLASAYSYAPLYAAGDVGSGQTIALFELEPNLASDIAAYQACYQLHDSVSYVAVEGGAGTGAGQGEAALDIETVMSLAPNANILVYQAPNTLNDAYAETAAIVSQNRASVISDSWGGCEADTTAQFMNAENTLFQEAAVQGQTFVVAAGDTGSEDCYQADTSNTSLSVGDPASQPFVTSVGGTRLINIGTASKPQSEIVWNDAYDGDGAGGGGISTQWPSPSWQTQYGIGGSGREVPDVSADADPETGYTMYCSCEFGGWQPVGGTSAAAPLWAALFTLANAACPSAVGFVNPTLYQAYLKDPVVVGHDVTGVSNPYNNNTNDYTGTSGGQYPVLTGYDMATGLGSPIANALIADMCDAMPGWTFLPGTAHNLSVGANGSAWVVGTSVAAGGYGIYRWTGSNWLRASGGATTIAVGPHGDPWLINSTDQIYHWNGTGWTHYAGSATDIAVGANGQVWVVGTNALSGGYGVWRWNGAAWSRTSGSAVTLAVGPNGAAWVVNSSHRIYLSNGNGWTLHSGAANDIAVGADGRVWVTGTDSVKGGYGIWGFNGSAWSPLAGAAIDISVGPTGAPWAINQVFRIYHR
jgi:subtilase family serine protease